MCLIEIQKIQQKCDERSSAKTEFGKDRKSDSLIGPALGRAEWNYFWWNISFSRSEANLLLPATGREAPFGSFKGLKEVLVPTGGVFTTGDFIYNPNSGKKERVGRLMLMHSNKREERKTVKTGEIAGVIGLKYTKTGHTLSDQNKVVEFESIPI